nr:helicase-related protein [Halochromatium glycolicum]
MVGDIITTWKERATDRPTLVFAVDIAHSKAIIEDFVDEGIAAAHLDAYTTADERERIIDAFRTGEIKVLSSVNVLGIGFDYPGASCAILARPTLSEALHMHQMGRAIRKAEGKTDAVILDHAGNTLRFGLPEHFEVPDLGKAYISRPRRSARTRTTPSAAA